VEISSQAIVEGQIETIEFGPIGVRFSSAVPTVGAGDFISVQEGSSLPERAIEVYVQKSREDDFLDFLEE